MFDILRRSRSAITDVQGVQRQSCLQVRIPADLVRRSTLAVSIESGQCYSVLHMVFK